MGIEARTSIRASALSTTLRTEACGELGLAGADAKPASRPPKAEIEQKLLAMLHVDGFVVCPEQGQRICDGEDDACLGQPENDRASPAENKRSKLLVEPESQRGFRCARDRAQ